MPNIDSLLKQEMARVARKEVRAETASLKKASTQYRSVIASLKREIAQLRKEIRKAIGGRRRKEAESVERAETPARRFSAPRLAAHRAKIGLSAKNYGTLLGVSPLSVYKWESGKVRPRASQLEAIAAVRKLGKREALARLEESASAGQ